ncbi:MULTISPECIES: RHS repeat-associated core domain-containing protein [unclassified Caballeronia]|uniref:RHS repeat-associated core domain-containing protein n=1 Tax=unclassified Caballeronia TaxID=2646786 RepID=UPI00285C9E88|nr:MULTISPECIES: RHS repeat-associated core domain-containing protein [unclassified Caballeronia]MDR5771231.1 RHS repeat-associated core domain-containing protein [Caballeronia sp. LZ002]MDR5800539.1 RHS repeat-associated core domain-containing protein [Caballeronia sp. LZ001]MDR5846667.1 RHS repeat-associated core domain-containing protein [Caballeronia sp. LZ003]
MDQTASGSTRNADRKLPAFGGERHDAFSNAYHLGNGYRAYSPALMRFRCPDSLSPFGAGGINPYAYCAGDPINRLDPSGHLSWQAWMGIGLGVVGLGLAAFTAGTSIAAAGGVIAAIESASAVGLAVGAVGVIGDLAAIASGAVEDSEPKASAELGWLSLASGGVGVTSAVLGAVRASMASRTAIAMTRPVAMGGDIRLLTVPTNTMYMFADDYKFGRRLNIVAHSSRMENGRLALALNSRRFVTEPSHLRNVIMLSHVDVPAYKTIRLIACFTADGDINSFAQGFANAMRKPVKAYEGQVWIPQRFQPSNFLTAFRQGRPGVPPSDGHRLAFFNARSTQFEIVKEQPGVSYSPHWFEPRSPSPPLNAPEI